MQTACLVPPISELIRSESVKLLFQLFVLFSFFGSTHREMSDNCFCQADEAEFTITSSTLLEFETSYGSLVIHDILYPEQRLYLEEITDATFVNLIQVGNG